MSWPAELHCGSPIDTIFALASGFVKFPQADGEAPSNVSSIPIVARVAHIYMLSARHGAIVSRGALNPATDGRVDTSQ